MKKLRNKNCIFKIKKYLIKFIKVKENTTFSISDPLGLKLLTRRWLNFSHLNQHKFRYGFRDTANVLCFSGAGIEAIDHYFLRCQNFAFVWLNFLNSIFELNVEFSNMNDVTLTLLLLFSSEKKLWWYSF